MRRITAILLTLAGVVGCAPDPIELRGIDLPAASMPDDFDLDVWAISFSRDFEPGSLSEGIHSYELNLDCASLLTEPVQASVQRFSITPLARSFDNVFLRLNGVGTSLLGPTGVFALRPDQQTTAAITVMGVSKEQATEALSCSGEVKLDDAGAEPLLAGKPFRP